MPSRSWQIWAIAGAFWALTAKFGRTFAARSMNSRTASDWATASIASRVLSSGSESDGTRQSVSPPTPSGARLVASTQTSGQPCRSASATSAAAASTCSQLSSTTSARRPARCSTAASSAAAPGHRSRVERSGQRRSDQLALGQRRELDPPHAVREAVERVGGHLQRQARLAAAARAGQREQARRGKRLAHVVEFTLATDEARQLIGQVVGQRVERAQRLERRRHVAARRRKDLLGAPEVAQAMHAQIDQLHAIGQAIDDEIVRRARQQRLPAVRDRPQPRAAIDRLAEVVALVAQLRLGGVQRDPHPQRRRGRPRLRVQRGLGVQRRGERIRRAGKRRDDAVALALLDRAHPAVPADRILQQCVATGDRQRHRIGVGLPQPRRALDVGQQERHRPRREVEARLLRSSPIHERPPDERPIQATTLKRVWHAWGHPAFPPICSPMSELILATREKTTPPPHAGGGTLAGSGNQPAEPTTGGEGGSKTNRPPRAGASVRPSA